MQEENVPKKDGQFDVLNGTPADAAKPEAAPAPKRGRRIMAITAGLAVAVAVGCGIGFAAAPMFDKPAPTLDEPAPAVQDDDAKKVVDGNGEVIGTVVEDDGCEHDWTMTYKTVHHDAVTHTEAVEPVYENETSYHSVCNDCLETIDGVAAQHLKDTGHSGYSTNVPIVNEVLVSEGYSREVVDSPAYEETVADKMVCTICGEEQDASALDADA